MSPLALPQSSACTWKLRVLSPTGAASPLLGGCTPAARTSPLLVAAAVTPRGPWWRWAEPWLHALLAGG